jgi:hypothetical protein
METIVHIQIKLSNSEEVENISLSVPSHLSNNQKRLEALQLSAERLEKEKKMFYRVISIDSNLIPTSKIYPTLEQARQVKAEYKKDKFQAQTWIEEVQPRKVVN